MYDAVFDAHCTAMAQISAEHRGDEATTTFAQDFQNTVLPVDDDHSAMAPDYFIEAFVKAVDGQGEDASLSAKIQNDVIAGVPINTVLPSFRTMKFNGDRPQTLLIDKRRPLHLRVTASPEFTETRTVGDSTLRHESTDSVQIGIGDPGRSFVPGRTLLAQLRIRREIATNLVAFRQTAA